MVHPIRYMIGYCLYILLWSVFLFAATFSNTIFNLVGIESPEEYVLYVFMYPMLLALLMFLLDVTYFEIKNDKYTKHSVHYILICLYISGLVVYIIGYKDVGLVISWGALTLMKGYSIYIDIKHVSDIAIPIAKKF